MLNLAVSCVYRMDCSSAAQHRQGYEGYTQLRSTSWRVMRAPSKNGDMAVVDTGACKLEVASGSRGWARVTLS